ncbi:FGGY-family carbohydrate kinase [Streptococcus oricebi]|uniref:Carbohydrate kinase n=1 Tax=Streptococcus oricebi TaxID=1547447 RepID=A0ABS5B4B8_9STRE|nr:FGGY-family carbohydrate kinase [Streptococcus oricebi]MBP2623678.1 carbohydrate kinase [Streptococcus oricebi]
MRYFLSIDYGGTNTKVILFDEEGQQRAVSSFGTMKIEEKPGYREVDLQKAWSGIAQGIRQVLEESQVPVGQVAAVATIGHGKGLYLLDKTGKEFVNGILSTDERASQLAKKFESRLDEIWPLTKQHVVGVQNPVLLRWLKEEQPQVYEQIGAVLSAKDFVRFKLTGLIHQEIGDASGNHWINFETGTYDSRITDFFQIPEIYDILAPLVDYKEIVGGVSAQAAAETGLLEGTPVIGGLFDIDACAIGSGVLSSDTFSIISGTWNINTYPSKKAASKESGLMHSYFPNRDFLVEAGSPTSAGNLDAMIKMLMMEEIQHLKQTGGSIYDLLEVFLAETDARFNKILFFPFLYGNNIGQNAEACFFGLTTQSSKSEMIRAVYEGVVFAHKQHIDQLIAGLGQAPKVLRLSGGATNSPGWMQMFADILNVSVETVDATELGGLGGAISCLQALDHLTLEQAVSAMVRVKERFEPQASETMIYNQKYQVYQNLLLAMAPAWKELCQLRKNLD